MVTETFGHLIGTNGDPVVIENIIYCSPATCQEKGLVRSIIARIQVTSAAKKIKCALYQTSDNIIVGQTEEKTIPVQATPTEVTFNFNSPLAPLEANTEYYICIWSEASSGTTFLLTKATSGTDSITDNLTYNGFPGTITADTTENDISADIFCTYIPNTGGIGTRHIRTDYPVEEGLIARTTKQTGERFLIPEIKSLVKANDKVGF